MAEPQAGAAFDGPGKYDRECEQARIATGAQGIVLLVYNGRLGQGFEVQGPLAMLAALPAVLRSLADQVERQNLQPAGLS